MNDVFALTERRHCLTYTKLDCAAVAIYGRRPSLREPSARAEASLYACNLARQCGIKKTARTVVLVPPTERSHLCFGKIGTRDHVAAETHNDSEYDVVFADGWLLNQKAGSGVVLHTRDCPTVVIENRATSEVAVVHAGRPQLSGELTGCGVLSQAVREIVPDKTNTNDVYAYVTGGIGARYFSHDRGGMELVLPFAEVYGEDVLFDARTGALDIFKVIVRVLTRHGLCESNVVRDDLCSFGTSWLSSKRADKPGVNWVVVARLDRPLAP
jgi:copper oxidase (laccase) domain-containing protein